MEAKHEVEGGGFTAHWDPHNEWNVPLPRIVEACGVLPGWAAEYFVLLHRVAHEDPETEPLITLKEWMEERYGFGSLFSSEATITEDYIHQYPEDPDLYPYLVMTSKYGPQMVQYQSALVSFRQSPEDEWFNTRMD